MGESSTIQAAARVHQIHLFPLLPSRQVCYHHRSLPHLQARVSLSVQPLDCFSTCRHLECRRDCPTDLDLPCFPVYRFFSHFLSLTVRSGTKWLDPALGYPGHSHTYSVLFLFCFFSVKLCGHRFCQHFTCQFCFCCC